MVKVYGLSQNFNIPGVTTPLMNGNTVVMGGGIKGFMPRSPSYGVDKSYENYENVRVTLRQAWNSKYSKPLSNLAVTPFRAVTNSGDLLSRVNYSCGGNCQSFQSRPGIYGLKTAFGSINSLCDNSGISPSACNVKYVYDSSNYTTYLKQRSINQNYNDISNSGNNSNAGQVSYKAIRRY